MNKSVGMLVGVVALASLAGTAGCRRAAAPPASPEGSPGAAAAPPAPAPPAYSGPTVDVPAGSRLVMRLDDNVDSAKGAGLRFRATLEAALLDATGKPVVPAGSKVLGIVKSAKAAGNVAGRSEVELAFTDLQVNGMLFPIQSQGVQAVGEGSGRDTGRKVAAGALVGAAFGGGNGAAKGAAIGGAAAMLTRGKQVKVPAGTVLELLLAAPAKVPAPADAQPAAAAVAPAAAPAPAPALVASGAAPAATPAAAPAAAAAPSPATDDGQKACVKKLMANGFTADEALASCKKTK